MGLSDNLKARGYNTFERATMYASPFVGFATGLLFSRYVLLHDVPSNDFPSEAIVWTLAAVGGPPFEIGGGVAGFVGGILGATNLRNKRIDKRNQDLENRTKNTSYSIRAI